MIKITFSNFGMHGEAVTFQLTSTTLPNGGGKTTLLNGYLWALTGRTLSGFEPRRTTAPADELTSVELTGTPFAGHIRRTLSPSGGTTLYVGGEVCTQTDFVLSCASRGVDVDFAALCADANRLTADALTSEDLRALLTRAGAMDGGEAATLRKEAATLRKQRKTAEQYALSNVTIPVRTVDPLSDAETNYEEKYRDFKRRAHTEPTKVCPTCGTERNQNEYNNAVMLRADAERNMNAMREEAIRIQTKRDAYDKETIAIEDAQRLIDGATKARADVQAFDARLRAIDDELREIEANAVRADLPDGVTLVTEQASKSGTVKSVCTLTYNGVPLKSVNRAKRVEICVRILADARTRKGMDGVPIIIDNAESVQGLGDIPNVIRLTVG